MGSLSVSVQPMHQLELDLFVTRNLLSAFVRLYLEFQNIISFKHMRTILKDILGLF